MTESVQDTQIKPTDLRGILKYVPQFRDHIFVIALDGSIIDDENFAHVITDIAVLRSLNIKVVLVHGIGRQLKALSEQRSIPLSDIYGSGPTDTATLELAIEASSLATHRLMEALTQNNLKYAVTNAVRGIGTGIVRGKAQGFTGKVDKIELQHLQDLLRMGILPVFSPILFDREGHPLRVNSDLLACDICIQLGASKLIYLTPHPGLIIHGEIAGNIPLEELAAALRQGKQGIDERLRSKARYAALALEAGTPRAHILDGRVFGCLLTEIFDKVGLGTMIHANDYQQIRPARKKDAQSLFTIVRNAAKTEALRHRTRISIEKEIQCFYVYEIDESIIGCFSLTPLDKQTVELGAVLVQPFYQGKGVGRKMVEFAILEATRKGYRKMVALSTQSYHFFQTFCQFADGSPADLSPERRKLYDASGRNSKILVKALAKPARSAPRKRK